MVLLLQCLQTLFYKHSHPLIPLKLWPGALEMLKNGSAMTWMIWMIFGYPHALGNLQFYLVGGIPTPLKNMSSSVGIMIPN